MIPRPIRYNRGMSTLSKKSLIVFDLDGTLAPSKSPLSPSMARALTALLKQKKVAVIGGGSIRNVHNQFVKNLTAQGRYLRIFFFFPPPPLHSTATRAERWKNVYAHFLSTAQKKTIRQAVTDVFHEIHYVPPKKIYGKTLEDRKSQMSYSFLGQDVVAQLGKKGVHLKEEWIKKNKPLKMKITRLLQKRLPDLEVHAAGFTTIDITKPGIDKGIWRAPDRKIFTRPDKRHGLHRRRALSRRQRCGGKKERRADDCNERPEGDDQNY